MLRTAGHRLSALAAAGARLARKGLGELTDLGRRLATHDVRATLRGWRAGARALALPYSRDEREVVALLFLPFLLVASAIVVHQWVRTLAATLAAVEAPEQEIAAVGPGVATRMPSLAALPRSIAREAVPKATPLRPVLGLAPAIRERPAAGIPLAAALPDAATRAVAPSALRPDTAIVTLSSVPPPAVAPSRAEAARAMLAPAGDKVRRIARPIAPPPLQAFEVGADGRPLPALCVAAPGPRLTASRAPLSGREPVSLSPDAFGLRLAEAAESQVGRLVIYNEAYRRIAYPMGDVHEMYGVCTDVVVRAYRALGLDLQALVHEARAGSGDTSIDHRRTDVLRRFFAAHGESLPVTPFAEDYLPGDIVTYKRTRPHIAIVSSVIAPSGRPMVVHNRGWGPQLEDALFVDRMTGHYRYRGPGAHRSAVRQASAGSAEAFAP